MSTWMYFLAFLLTSVLFHSYSICDEVYMNMYTYIYHFYKNNMLNLLKGNISILNVTFLANLMLKHYEKRVSLFIETLMHK